jgi:hypothetical protein
LTSKNKPFNTAKAFLKTFIHLTLLPWSSILGNGFDIGSFFICIFMNRTGYPQEEYEQSTLSVVWLGVAHLQSSDSPGGGNAGERVL